MWTEISDTAIIKKLGERIRAQRIRQVIKQEELAERSGVALSTIRRIESGQAVSLQLFISVLRTMGLLENLELLVPETKISPLQLQKLQGRKVKRIRSKKNKEWNQLY